MNPTAPLFRPFEVGTLSLKNLVVMAPMTRALSPEGVPGPDVAAYYRRRAEGGVGLIITEGTTIDHPAAAAQPNVPQFHGEAALAGWTRVVEEVHAAGGKIIPQLWHVGMARKPGALPNPEVAPVGPNNLTDAQVTSLIAAYGKAAGEAKRLGFDGLEIHGAHGYLIDQFFWDKTNARSDRFGGGLVGRAKFAVEIVKACRAAVGPGFPIVFRFSQWKSTDYQARLASHPQDLGRLLEPLVLAGTDVFHCSTRRFWEPEFAGSPLNLAGWTKKMTGKPTITVGSVGLDGEFTELFKNGTGAETAGLDDLLHRLAAKEFDLVAVGRALISNPNWVELIRTGKQSELKAFEKAQLATLA